MTKSTPRTIAQIAAEIQANWKPVNYAAAPYLSAMHSLTDKESMYGLDSAQSIVAYFLCNASTFRGEVARRTKAELKSIVK
jgi:hypothetical protein